MKDLIKYTLHDYLRSQKYFPPTSTYFILILIFYTYKPNPIIDSYAVTALILFVTSAWLCMSVLSLDAPVQRQIMILHIKSSHKYYIAKLIAIWLIAVGLAVFAFVYPLVFGMFAEPVSLKVGFVSLANHILLATLGISIASFFNKSMMESTVNAYGGLVLTLILSFASLGIYKVLPSFIKYVAWLLPPAVSTQIPLIQWDGEMIGELSLIPFIWIFIYSVVLFILFLQVARLKK
ncbi:hypothetical protein [Oceanobacillus sp. J11TS1]|uniref:hypothetical protein n=1 Tax=Oceanobacillus sp. J11TS1 TaxID=2807191 RepID=UPI001B099F48|nr:hypothetical protein [Oceanobacillus sp. J11TS1]GIO21442.1 ABC transporter permease [Oceanobacillus sp. J11TS1]